MRTFLIDMYSDQPISRTRYRRGDGFLEHCPFFDTDSYFAPNEEGIATRGGPRYRLFWEGINRDSNPPYLINIPLVKWRKDLDYERGTHLLSGIEPSPILGAKLHFKFFSDLYAYAEQEAERKEHWDDAAQYRTYWQVLEDSPNMTAMYERSVRYRSSAQLVELGLIRSSDPYAAYVNAHMTPVQKLRRWLRRR